MNRADMITRVRSYTRDLSASIFRSIDVTSFINEGIDRMRSRISQLKPMIYLSADDEIPIYLPSEFHYLISVYAASRCFGQDERHYQSSTLMNEFETKLEELYAGINDGSVVILNASGVQVDTTGSVDYVKAVYYTEPYGYDVDLGVNGV